MFNWDEFKKSKISVWCKTEEIAKNFLEECDKHDIKWNSKHRTSSDTYWKYKEYNTCYFYKYGCSKGLAWGSKEFAESEHYTIVDWSKEMELKNLLTYREIIANIKEGEIYNCEDEYCLISNIELKNRQLKVRINLKGFDDILIDKPMFRLKEEIDWNKVPKGTIILVRNSEESGWVKREFIAYLDKKEGKYKYLVYNNMNQAVNRYKYAKLKDNNY